MKSASNVLLARVRASMKNENEMQFAWIDKKPVSHSVIPLTAKNIYVFHSFLATINDIKSVNGWRWGRFDSHFYLILVFLVLTHTYKHKWCSLSVSICIASAFLPFVRIILHAKREREKNRCLSFHARTRNSESTYRGTLHVVWAHFFQLLIYALTFLVQHPETYKCDLQWRNKSSQRVEMNTFRRLRIAMKISTMTATTTSMTDGMNRTTVQMNCLLCNVMIKCFLLSRHANNKRKKKNINACDDVIVSGIIFTFLSSSRIAKH